MGFYLRKSVSVGPFRFNLSNSGIGISAGVPGFRVGSGPRGNYVRIGRGGVYYQQTIPTAPNGRADRLPLTEPRIPIGTHAPLAAIESAGASQIVDSSSEELLREINEKRRKLTLGPLAILGAIVLVLATAIAWWAIVLSAVAILAARYRDKIAKTVVILYDLEPAVEASFTRFGEWADAIGATKRAWHVSAQGRVYDRKYHAGASALVQRSVTALHPGEPPFIKTNARVLRMSVGKQTLYFFPDRLLIDDGAGVGAVSYRTLDVSVSPTQFIETESVPGDATVVGQTWRYVNKSGGPDRRFNNNPRIPICMYDELTLRTSSGLHEVVQISRSGIGEGFAAAVRHLGSVVP
jgi:hypothetical protein